MTQTLKKISNVATHNERSIIFALIACIAFVSFFYGFFVKQTIVNVVEREQTIKEARVLNTKIGDLEASYIALKNNITLDFAYARGFKDAPAAHFISKKALGKAISQYNAN